MKSSLTLYSELEEILRDYKIQGNTLFGEKRYREAELVYCTGLASSLGSLNFDFDSAWTDLTGDELGTEFLAKNRYSDILTKLSINAMQAALKSGEFLFVIFLADAAFQFVGILDSDRMKAHYRRGVVYLQMEEYKLAAMDLFFALNLSPGDSIVKALLHKAEEHLGYKATTIIKMAIVPVDCPKGNDTVLAVDMRLVDGPWRRHGFDMEYIGLLRLR